MAHRKVMYMLENMLLQIDEVKDIRFDQLYIVLRFYPLNILVQVYTGMHLSPLPFVAKLLRY